MAQESLDQQLAKVFGAMDRLTKQFRFAASQAINDVAFKVRAAEQAEMDARFDRVTPYIRRSIRVDMANPETLVARVSPKYMGGKGVEPQKILQAEVFGGPRRQKASEKALQRVGILPSGYSIVPGEACPLDQYGNIKGSFLVQLISYLQAFGEQGYRANMTDKRKSNLAKAGRTASGYKTLNGVVYFVSYGRLRGGRTNHLAPGIWSKTGIHGVDVKPILMFVRAGNYASRFDFFGVGEKEIARSFRPAFTARLDAALRTAKP